MKIREGTIAHYLSCEDDVPDATTFGVEVDWAFAFLVLAGLGLAGFSRANLARLLIVRVFLSLDKGLVPRRFPVSMNDNVVLVNEQRDDSGDARRREKYARRSAGSSMGGNMHP
jgi:hypothetical protein